jgi:hypothetical protein
MTRRLGAISTVLRAPSRLDRKQNALLNIDALLVFAMNGMGLIKEFEERQTIQG